MQKDNDWKKRLGVVYSTDKNFAFSYDHSTEQATLPPVQQQLIVSLDAKNRSGKKVTLVEGFIGKTDDLAALAKQLKTICGVGGGAKNGQILLQGDCRSKTCQALVTAGYVKIKQR